MGKSGLQRTLQVIRPHLGGQGPLRQRPQGLALEVEDHPVVLLRPERLPEVVVAVMADQPPADADVRHRLQALANAPGMVIAALTDVERLWDYQFSSPTGAFFDAGAENGVPHGDPEVMERDAFDCLLTEGNPVTCDALTILTSIFDAPHVPVASSRTRLTGWKFVTREKR